MPEIAICIPARDEASVLPALFAALEALESPPEFRVTVCLLLDGCVDGSAALAQAYQQQSRHGVILSQTARSSGSAGKARHLAMMMGERAMTARDGLLLTTDADSQPAPRWVKAMSYALSMADVVAGRITRHGDQPSLLQDRVEDYYDALFELRRQLDPVPWEASITHHFTGGANLGLRRGAYRTIGGFAPVRNGEDARLIDDASRAGLWVRRDAASLVTTSDRRDGRATGGLAIGLRALDGAHAASILVTHPADAAWQYRMQAAARMAYTGDLLKPFAEAVALTHDHLIGVARDCPNAEAFAMRIVPIAPDGMRSIGLPTAELELSRMALSRRAA